MAVRCFQIRRDNGLRGNFKFEVIDSRNLGPGHGLVAYATTAARNAGKTFEQITPFVKNSCSRVYTYGYISDLLYVYTRAKARNEQTITLSKFLAARILGLKPILKFHDGNSSIVGKASTLVNAFEQLCTHLKTKLRQGLLIDTIIASYSGTLTDITQLPQYASLEQLAKQLGVRIMLTKMSVAVAIYLGEKAFLISYSADESTFSNK